MSKAFLFSAAAVLLMVSLVKAQAQAQVKFPADGDNNGAAAIAALKNSTRHGEWVDVAVPGTETKIKSFVVYPERKDKAPVVIVIHEIFGLTDWVRAVGDQLAAEGFIAIAPDLVSGMGPNGGGTDSFKTEPMRDAFRKLTADETAKRLDAVHEYAIAL